MRSRSTGVAGKMPAGYWAYGFYVAVGLGLMIALTALSVRKVRWLGDLAAVPRADAVDRIGASGAIIAGRLGGSIGRTPLGEPAVAWIGAVTVTRRSGKSTVTTNKCSLVRLHGLVLETSGQALPVVPPAVVCTTVDASVVRSTSIQTDATNPNGVKSLVVMLTLLEGSVFALAEWKGDHAFHTPYFIVPAGLDVGWGIFRSITIHPEIIRGATVSVDDGEHAGSTSAASAPCPAGTDIALAGDSETLVAHVGAGGWLELAELPPLIAFLTGHSRIELAGAGWDAGVKLDTSAAADIVAKAPGPARVDPGGQPRPYGVPVDFPPAALCRTGADCPSSICLRGPDGVGFCR